MKLNNTYYILRHGEALSNVKSICSSWPEKFKNPLTEHGIGMIRQSAMLLKGKGIQLIFTSDLLRAKMTAEIAAKALKLRPKFDKRLREVNFGTMNGFSMASLDKAFSHEKERITRAIPRGETYNDIHVRVYDFLKDVDEQYKGKAILVVSHECPLLILEAAVHDVPLKELFNGSPRHERIERGEVKKLN